MSNQSKNALLKELGLAIAEAQNARDAFDEAAIERLRINRSDLLCLTALMFRGPMTAGELAAEAGLTPGATTAMVDRMEQASHVRRLRDTADRRRVLVEVTPETRKRAEEIWGPLAQAAGAMLKAYSEEELTLLLDFMRKDRQLQLEQTERLHKETEARASSGKPALNKGRQRGE